MAFLSPATTSSGLVSLAWGLSGACCSPQRVVYDASLQGLIEYLYTRGVSTFFHAAFTAHRAEAVGSRLHAFVRPSSASCYSPEVNPKICTKRNSRYLAGQLNDFRDRSFAVVRTHPPTRNELNRVFGKVWSSRI